MSEPMPRGAGASTPSVLVAEDNAISRSIIQHQLLSLGCDVLAVEDGEEAVRAWRTGAFSIVMTDLQMPRRDGFEVSAAIRAEEPRRRTAIIALTAETGIAEVARCSAAGMDECIAKPASLQTLRGVLDRWHGFTANRAIATPASGGRA